MLKSVHFNKHKINVCAIHGSVLRQSAPSTAHLTFSLNIPSSSGSNAQGEGRLGALEERRASSKAKANCKTSVVLLVSDSKQKKMLSDQTYPKRPRRLGPSSHRPRARRPPLSTFQHEPWKIRNLDHNVSGIQILHHLAFKSSRSLFGRI